MIKKYQFFSVLFLFTSFIYSQQIKVDKIEPGNWWQGMKWNKVQLMVYGENLSHVRADFSTDDIEVIKVHEVESGIPGTYTFIDINISDKIKPGNYKLKLFSNNTSLEVDYPILERKDTHKKFKGFSPEDVIYLIMPDRFSNGDISNDIVEGYGTNLDRSKGSARHGGDLKGIINHLDYIKETGYTAIWLNPVVENNTQVSYHGYGATDFYKIDPRFGTNELYKELVEKAHNNGIKVILDHVANHIHINHPWMKNLPLKEWINGSAENFVRTNHDKVAITDIHGDKSTVEASTRGWFTEYMPDLNSSNPYMANYIIQNTIWWMEYAGIDGIREDTYPYPDPVFMSKWAKAILEEYPNTNIVGEVWKGDPAFLATYQQKSRFTPGFDSNLPALTDFGLADALRFYMSGRRNLSHIYETLAMDFLYNDPNNLVTFIDNHDLTRAMYVAKEDTNKVKIALQILLTTRGIPQLYYGNEIAMIGGEDDGAKRTDFPGGFQGDSLNAFMKYGRTALVKDMYDLTKMLIQIRKENKALALGKLIHFPPREDVYVYFRILDDEKIMIVVNDNKETKSVDLAGFKNILEEEYSLKDLEAGTEVKAMNNKIQINGQEVNIYKIN